MEEKKGEKEGVSGGEEGESGEAGGELREERKIKSEKKKRYIRDLISSKEIVGSGKVRRSLEQNDLLRVEVGGGDGGREEEEKVEEEGLSKHLHQIGFK